MAREKAVIEKEWITVDKSLVAAIATCDSAKLPTFEKFEEQLKVLQKPWAAWVKVCDEAVKKVNDKDWKDDKKLPPDRAAFKKWVLAQSKKRADFDKKIIKCQTDFANVVKSSDGIHLKLKTMRGEFTKSNGVYQKDRNAEAALTRSEDLLEQVGKLTRSSTMIRAVAFTAAEELTGLLLAQCKTYEQANAAALKFEGEIEKITYDSLKKDLKMYQSYCSLAKQPEHFEFMRLTNFGAKGDKGVYDKFIKTNSVNVSAKLLEEFEKIAANPKPDWGKAPWKSVADQIDGMLKNDTRHIEAFKKQLRAQRRA